MADAENLTAAEVEEQKKRETAEQAEKKREADKLIETERLNAHAQETAQ